MADETKSPQTTIFVTVEVDPSNADKFLAAMRPCYEGCAKESELIFFHVFRDEDHPGVFHFIEYWAKDRKWFEEIQMNKDYYHPYSEITQPMWIKPRVIRYLDPIPGWRTLKSEFPSLAA
ncbi:hypothetical protein L228DRAFT_285045 [Xylona heveae TC161]|uniref:ABM domain-containing protein n=1 Tax=Xylona heveae (strain CBS 132557 / TC161) TaxID=1328760 RepID=A0A165AE35_XYLHT|nr:hypothetical protein L228DRAFT_285045 [Xylona heveae TC161]KZF20326.1 hypothetical protein L228DRAFT_285045 [Xylona heveae TC161]